jgi:hypothetical protein
MHAAVLTPPVAPVWDGPWGRLALAALFSGFLHFVLIAGFPVDLIGGELGAPTVITARLEPGPEPEAAAAAAAPAPEADSPPPSEVKPPDAVAAKASAVAKAPEKTSPLAGAELPLIRDDAYYPGRQLDVFPTPLVPVRPVCSNASEFREEITLLALINEYGFVDDVGVVKGPASGLCVQEMIALVKGVRFSPGIKEKREVKSRMQFVFRPEVEGAAKN